MGGIYTSLQVPELGLVFDCGIAPRTFAGVDDIFLSHGHVDHSGALSTLLGTRALMSKTKPPRVYLPAEIEAPLTSALEAMSALQRYDLLIDAKPMLPGDVLDVRRDLKVRAFRTYHPVPSLGYQFFRIIKKLKPEFLGLPGPEIAERKHAGEDLFDITERLELAYATDTLVKVLDKEPSLYDSRVLIIECTFLDERKSLEAARAGCHIHLDELIERADRFNNEAIVLMHFSQIYKPSEIGEILARRCPPSLLSRLVPFVTSRNDWPG